MSPTYSKELLRQRASWIRDDLDPRIARDGPDCMHPDDVLTLHELFVGLQDADLSISTLRFSRIHLAILEVSGKATRWPKRLAKECDKTVEVWTKKYGKLSEIRPRLFKPDGRLYGVCTGRELTRNALIRLWSEQNPAYTSPDRGMQHGSLGFKPGDWWINGMFAFHAGIIDLNCTDGGICANRQGAYAVVMKDNDEICTETADKFKYRCKPNDPGRFRMTSADFRSRYPIRVLRSHTLNSLWSPRSGIRYEGLHRITGWTLRPANPTDNIGENLLWEVELERDHTLEDESNFVKVVLKHPLAEETDDYVEYKRIRKEMLYKVREEIRTGIPASVSETPPPLPAPGKPAITIQSPPMSPKTEQPFFVGDYCLMREPVLPGSPESPPVSRTSFFQPPPIPTPRVSHAKTGPVDRSERVAPSQPRSRTIPQNLRKTLSVISAETKGKKSEAINSPRKANQPPNASERNPHKTKKETLTSLTPAKDAKSGIAKSLSRIFSDGARDSDVPESPFGSVFSSDQEPSSYPFDNDLTQTAAPSSSIAPVLQQSVGGKAQDSFSSSGNPAYRQVHWGTPEDNDKEKEDKAAAEKNTNKSRHRQRRDRAVYEAFEREECPEPRLLLAALNEVWDDCGEAEYPDMVLEEPIAYESNSGYSGGFGAGSRSEDYLKRIPPGGIDVERFIAQQAAVAAEGVEGQKGKERGQTARRSWHAGDEKDYSHEICRVLREMLEVSNESSMSASPGSGGASAGTVAAAARRQSHRWSSGGGSSGGGSVGDKSASGLVRVKRSSLSAFDTRMPGLGLEDGARAGRGPLRPTIVRFSGMLNRQSLHETVDEVVDEGAAVAEENAGDGKRKAVGKGKASGQAQEAGFLF